ncbi:MAG: GDP-L-fucose synthase [Ferruginibacter sp.]|nr:GDP-L-fucose synthase [Ferruginibacter sp.]
MNPEIKIFVAGHNGMVGSAIVKKLKSKEYNNIILRSSKELDLRNQQVVNQFFEAEKPNVVFDAAARVGGILANNNYPYQFLMDNMQIQNNLIDAAHQHNVSKFVFLGSSCIYPKLAPQPLKEEYLLTSSLEPTNEWYAIAKISGVKACEAIRKQFNKDFLSLMPTNVYGPGDNFDLNTSHVLPAMIRKFYEAKQNNNTAVTLWGNGSAMREFIHVNDLADAAVFAFENNLTEHLYNTGTGVDLTIKELAYIIQEIVGHTGEIIWDETKPNGTPRKLLDVSKLSNAGWKSKIELRQGICETYNWFKENVEKIREVQI